MKSIVKAVFTLTFFTFIERTLGFLFKIYLSRELGAVGLGIYQVSMSVFFVLLTLTTSGIPLIVSKLTAKFRAEKNVRGEHALTSSALIIEVVTALVVCAAIFIFQDAIGGLFASRQSMTLLLLLLPAIFFSGVYSAFRGNLWGRQRYTTVSLLEILEQIVRIVLCIVLFYLGFDKVRMTALSLSLACVVSATACAVCYFCSRGRLKNPRGYLLPLLKSSAPITVIRASSSLNNSIIALVVPFLLTAQGMSKADSMYVFGMSVGMAYPLLYLPITVVGSLAFVMIPTLSSSMASGDMKDVRKQIETAVSFSILISALFVPMFFSLGGPIGSFIYNNADSGNFLAFSAWLLIPLSVENIVSSMMNSLDLEVASFVNYLIGSIFLFAILFAFYGHFNIKVLSIGMGVSLTVSTILDVRSIRKKTGISLSFMWTLLKCAGLLLPTVFLTKSLYAILPVMPEFFRIAIAGGTGIVFMALLALVFGAAKFDFFKSRRKKPLKTIAKQPRI